MKSITFYSYKGGTGRTLAAINFAVYLARLKLKTVILDLDLEAPGVDSKFPGYSLPANQLGILDYLLKFQHTNSDPGSVLDIYTTISISTQFDNLSVGLIPAGDYLSDTYAPKLNALDWGKIFSDERDGVAFFKQLIKRIEVELRPDFLIIDSRTGIGEVGAVCTQQLADEVVILTSLASESIKMTKQLVNLIEQGEIVQALDKSVEVKVVLARIPKPDDPVATKARYSSIFGVPEKQLFFLFSSSALEQGEFIAFLGRHKDDELVSNYIQLFHGLDIELADRNIRDQINLAEKNLLSVSPDESESRILELTAVYPHPEVYRTAMRYYRLRQKNEGVIQQGFRLLDVKADDEEAQQLIIESYLTDRPSFGHFGYRRRGKADEAIKIATLGWKVFARGSIIPYQLVPLASLLEEVGLLQQAHAVAMAAIDSQLPNEWRIQTYSLAARTALKTNQTGVASELIVNIPQEQLRGSLAEFAINSMSESGDLTEAFELALKILRMDITFPVITLAAELATKLGRKSDLVNVLLNSNDLEFLVNGPDNHERLTKLGLEEVLRGLPEANASRRR